MGTISVNRLGALALIVGPVLAIIFFLIEPGGLLVDRADPTDAVASITALASNPALAHLSAFVVPLGLIVTLYGLYVLQSGVRDGGGGDALSRLGFGVLVIANFGWIVSLGLNHVIANTGISAPQALQAVAPVYSVESGIALTSSLAASLGFLVLSLGLYTRGDFNKNAALVVAVASIVALVSLIIGISDTGLLGGTLLIARICYIVWVLWMIMLGVSLLKTSSA